MIAGLGRENRLASFHLWTEADGDFQIRGGLAVEGEARVALEQALAHDQGDALGFAEDFPIEVAGVVELEGDALRRVFNHAVGDERVGIVELAVRPHRDAAAAAGVADFIDVVTFALVVVIGLVDFSVGELEAVLDVPLVDDRVGDSLEPAVDAAVLRAGSQRRAVGAEGDEVVFPGEIILALRARSGRRRAAWRA